MVNGIRDAADFFKGSRTIVDVAEIRLLGAFATQIEKMKVEKATKRKARR